MNDKRNKLIEKLWEAHNTFDALVKIVEDLERETGDSLEPAFNALDMFSSVMREYTKQIQQRYPLPSEVVDEFLKDLRNRNDTPPEA